MENPKELSIAEKKKEILAKIQEVIDGFRRLKEELLEINTFSEQLRLVHIHEEEKKKILAETSQRMIALLKNIEALKQNHAHRSNTEIHTAHHKISKQIWYIVEWIITETKLKTIITISLKLPNLVTQLWKHLKTGIGIEILADSFEKFENIASPLDLESIKTKIETQITNIDQRIEDAQNICQVMEYLDLSGSNPILSDLIEYILGGKSYDEVKEKLQEQWVYIEEIVIKPIEQFEEEKPQILSKVSPFQIPQSTTSDKEKITKKKLWTIHTFFKTLKIWLNTDRTVTWKDAKQKILKEVS